VNWKGQGQNLDDFKYFKRWFEELSARPALQRGLAVTAGEPPEDPNSLSAEEKERRAKLLYNQRARPAPEGGLLRA
jgi:GSH-dependent disulfide-bond oxidoreductase